MRIDMYYEIRPIDRSNNIYYNGRLQSTINNGTIYKFSNITQVVTNQNTHGRLSFPTGTMEFSKHNYTFEMMGAPRTDGKSRRKSIKRKRRRSKSRIKSIKRKRKSRRRYLK